MSDTKQNANISSELITGKTIIWQRLTNAATNCRVKSFVAVAYFSKNAAAMLPLTEGSILVVDANENTVKLGQTCPDELLKLSQAGVKIFSFTGLHAKVFVFNNELYIGSTNVSAYSANYLEEAIFRTNEKRVVKETIAFIKRLLIKQLSEFELTELQKLYKSPKFFAPKLDGKRPAIKNSHEQKVYVVKLRTLKRGFDKDADFKQGEKKASQLNKNDASHFVDTYRHVETHKPKAGDVVIRITTDEGNITVSPPATILNIRKIKNSKRVFVYVAALDVRDKKLATVENKLKTTELKKAGLKDSSLAARINSMWI